MSRFVAEGYPRWSTKRVKAKHSTPKTNQTISTQL